MCSLQEHIDREARARKASEERLTFTQTFEPTPEMEEIHGAIREAYTAYAIRRAADIELHCAMGLMIGCGVRIKQYQDGSYEIAIDGTVPPREIYEEHPDQPAYGMIFED